MQRLDPGEVPTHLSKGKLHQKKVMLTVWGLAIKIIHNNFSNPIEIITVEKHCQEIDKLHQELQHLRPTSIDQKEPILLHDNVRMHLSQMTFQKLNKLNYETLHYPAYSANLSMADCLLFFFSSISISGKRKSSATKLQLKMHFKNYLVPGLHNYRYNII